MQRRQFQACGLAALILLATTRAQALTLGELSNADASNGVKAALEQGAVEAQSRIAGLGTDLESARTRLNATLQELGVEVTERVAHQLPANPHNQRYLDTKRDRTGHLLR